MVGVNGIHVLYNGRAFGYKRAIFKLDEWSSARLSKSQHSVTKHLQHFNIIECKGRTGFFRMNSSDRLPGMPSTNLIRSTAGCNCNANTRSTTRISKPRFGASSMNPATTYILHCQCNSRHRGVWSWSIEEPHNLGGLPQNRTHCVFAACG